MSGAVGTGHDRDPDPNDPEAIRQDIEDTREHMRETVDEISHRIDVRARAKDTARDAAQRANAIVKQADAYARANPDRVRRSAAVFAVAVLMFFICRRCSRRTSEPRSD